MNDVDRFPLPSHLIPRALPAQAMPEAIPAALTLRFDPREVGKLLVRLTQTESALYGITRDWRYDTAGRTFVRLHALLDRQFTEIGLRLVRLVKRSRDFGVEDSAGRDVRPAGPLPTTDHEQLEAHIVRGLLARHEGMLSQLQAGQARFADLAPTDKTAILLTDLIASHEEDAFMLRALLWEVENAHP